MPDHFENFFTKFQLGFRQEFSAQHCLRKMDKTFRQGKNV